MGKVNKKNIPKYRAPLTHIERNLGSLDKYFVGGSSLESIANPYYTDSHLRGERMRLVRKKKK